MYFDTTLQDINRPLQSHCTQQLKHFFFYFQHIVCVISCWCNESYNVLMSVVLVMWSCCLTTCYNVHPSFLCLILFLLLVSTYEILVYCFSFVLFTLVLKSFDIYLFRYFLEHVCATTLYIKFSYAKVSGLVEIPQTDAHSYNRYIAWSVFSSLILSKMQIHRCSKILKKIS